MIQRLKPNDVAYIDVERLRVPVRVISCMVTNGQESYRVRPMFSPDSNAQVVDRSRLHSKINFWPAMVALEYSRLGKEMFDRDQTENLRQPECSEEIHGIKCPCISEVPVPGAQLLVHDSSPRETRNIKPSGCGLTFKVAELQNYVQGNFQFLRLNDGSVLVVNNDGRDLGLQINTAATKLYYNCSAEQVMGAKLVGDVVHCQAAMLDLLCLVEA